MPLRRLDEAMGVGRRGYRHEARPTAQRNAPELLLPGEAAASTLSTTSTAAETHPQPVENRGRVLRVYKWSQFHGREEVTEFDEAHFACEGKFSQSSSEGHKEYQDRLRAIHLRKEGMQKGDIAKALGRSEKFVAKWWQKENKEVPRPWGVHEYLTKDMGRNDKGLGATNGATLTDDSVSDTATWWRDVEVRRKFANDPAIYEEILKNTEWKPSNARTRDFATGAYHLKYDSKGNIRWEGHQGGKYKPGLSPAMDKAMQKLFAEYGIADRTSGVITNWYPDGQGNLGSHRHDCWTALFSFGHERILTIDNTPMLMQDGDLCIFGTQRHGVPIMPEVTEGRITLVVFFYPDKMQKQGMWQTITDPETMAPSRPLVKMLHDTDLGASAEQQSVENREELFMLEQMGFAKSDAYAALRSCGFDVQRAAELLLMAGATALSQDLDGQISGETSAVDAVVASQQGSAIVTGKTGRFWKRQTVVPQSTASACPDAAAASSGLSSSSGGSTAAGSSDHSAASAVDSSDEAFAWRLHEQDKSNTAACSPGFPGTPLSYAKAGSSEMTDDEVAALALHLEEMERQHKPTLDPALLASQFQEYDDAFTLQDAERWNGHGDLMHSPFSREHLSLEKMDKANLYSVGHGDMLEKGFWEMMQCHSIRVVYDIRQTDYRGELYSRHQRFSVSALKAQCRTRGIVYKSMPLGRESAYGTLAHIRTDEGQHTLIELVWQAKRRRTAFLGKEEDWRDDSRQVAAEELVRAGHTVEHVRTDGSTERHTGGVVFPDWLVREEERLKLVEKKRQAGELVRPQKSSVDRSSESVASRLSRPAEELDAMVEMRGAANQKELIVAQRKLARYQRIAEEKGALAAKVVTNTPAWILDEAQQQAEWVAAKKKEKEQAAVAGRNAGSSKLQEIAEESADTTACSSHAKCSSDVGTRTRSLDGQTDAPEEPAATIDSASFASPSSSAAVDDIPPDAAPQRTADIVTHVHEMQHSMASGSSCGAAAKGGPLMASTSTAAPRWRGRAQRRAAATGASPQVCTSEGCAN